MAENTQVHHRNHGGALTLSPAPTIDEGGAFTLQRKTPLQLHTLEFLYQDDKNPTQSRLEDYASALGLAYEQVRRWYVERRRKDRKNGAQDRRGSGSAGSTSKAKSRMKQKKRLSNLELREVGNGVRRPFLAQDMLYSSDYIFKKIFRKDGPPLGLEFDRLPSSAFQGHSGITDSGCPTVASQDEQRAPKRRKVSKPATLDSEHQPEAPTKKHGKGKGLMSVWQLMQSNNSCSDNARTSKRRKVLPCKNNSPVKRHGMGKGLMTAWKLADLGSENNRSKRQQKRKPVSWRRPVKKLLEKKKPPLRRKKVESSRNENKKSHREICKLALNSASYAANLSLISSLEDDEEFELRVLHAGPNPLTCSAHFSTGGSYSCCLCKGLLPKFPPESVRMRKLLSVHPWDSLELEKKLLKVFHFLYTYAVTIDLCPFTLDEFAKAFLEKDSLLMGKLHICLLGLLLSDIEKELCDELSIHTNKNCMFLNLLQMAENRKTIVKFWKTSLNALTWSEILRQVMAAAGFGSEFGAKKKACVNKEADQMAKFGLRSGTLKGEVFSILLEQGNKGMKVADLAMSSQVVDLNLGKQNCELEDSICSILASDITLFEKISLSSYRLRLSSIMKKDEDTQSDNEDCGSIDDESRDCSVLSIKNSECDSGTPTSGPDTNKTLSLCTVIDESHPGESWLLGLMEGEYSDLSIKEKLDALLALVDLLSAGSSIRKEDPSMALAECVPRLYQHGSGGKIKRLTMGQHILPPSSYGRETCGAENGNLSSDFCPIDSSVVLSKLFQKETSSSKEKGSSGKESEDYLHPMQSIFLGSDRRYNRYWLFLGPCDADDPGHTRVYFQSSEDGHWEVIESEEALCALVASLNIQGRREATLLASLEKCVAFLQEEMSSRVVLDVGVSQSAQSDVSEIDRVNEDSPSPVSNLDGNLLLGKTSHNTVMSSDADIVVVDKKVEVQEQHSARCQAYDLWIWSCFYSDLNAVKYGKRSYVDSLTRCGICHDLYWRDERHCKACHKTFELDFDLEEKYAIHVAMCQGSEDADLCPIHKVLPSKLQALKAAIHAIELLMPEDAMIGAWKKCAHNLWVRRLRRTSSLHELLQVIGDFVGSISVDWLLQCNVTLHCDSMLQDLVACFQNLPQTSSAVALWLVKLDALVAPYLDTGDVGTA